MLFEELARLMDRGGVLMWPLAALSVIAVALAFERMWFWVRTNSARRVDRLTDMTHRLRAGDTEGAKRLAEQDDSIYGRIVRALVDGDVKQSMVGEVVESHRPAIERFMPTLSTIITAAPMVGILGTVIGIIRSFHLLTGETMARDVSGVGAGIAEALITTAAGLVIALVILFPYNAFRAQIDRTLGRIEVLAAATIEGQTQDTSE